MQRKRTWRRSEEKGEHRGEEDLDQRRPPPSSLPLQPEIPLLVDDGGFHDQVKEILIAKLEFSFGVADKTLKGGGGELATRRRYCSARIVLFASFRRDVHCSLFCDHGLDFIKTS